MKRLIHIGTSGFSYPHWNKVFYPEKQSQTERLTFFATQFSLVEINTTFYHLPSRKTIVRWAEQTPKSFIFSLKISRYITHIKKLHVVKKVVTKFFTRMKPLKKKARVVLIQLPPSFKKNIERLAHFINYLPAGYRYTIEFRNVTWFDEEVYSLLEKHNIALTFTDLGGKLSPLVVTADFIYIRLHGPKKRYQGSYSNSNITTWKKRIQAWAKQKLAVYCLFDNDEKGYAILDARRLKKALKL